MQFRELKLLSVAAVVVVALGLAGCGGGDDEDQMSTDGTEPVCDAVCEAENRAKEAEERAKEAERKLAEKEEADKKAAEEARKKASAEAAKASAKLGKAMYAALGPPISTVIPQNALGNAGAALGARGILITPADGAGAIPDGTTPDPATLTAGDSAGDLGGWTGTMYSHSKGTGAAKVSNDAVVYDNKGPATGKPFGDEHTIITADGDDKGYVLLVTGGNPASGVELADVMAPTFTHSGTQTHTKDDKALGVYIRGTYDGAPGEYRCTGTTACTSTNDGKGSPSGLGGTWHFKPDAGAMTSKPDAHYLYYGWWVSKDADGDPTAASAFAGVVGTVSDATLAVGFADQAAADALTGSATYVGHAAGKFAMSNALDGTGSAGHFTADAELEANFGEILADNDNGVTGTIDNFRLNDGSEDPGWSVTLNRSSAWAADGAITGPAQVGGADVGTVWSINGNKAKASGTWSGQMYDEKPGNPPAGDGSNVPTTVTGTFYSEFSNIGRMVGAFGADKQ